MRAIIIGVPGRGKTRLANRIIEDKKDIRVIQLGPLRSALGIHEPHKGYETEVAPSNISLLLNVIDKAVADQNEFIIEGYGLSPEYAISLSGKYNAKTILLTHASTTADEDVQMLKKYDAKDKWTAFRSDEYLLELFKFYKEVEQKWIEDTPNFLAFDTRYIFDEVIEKAYYFLTLD